MKTASTAKPVLAISQALFTFLFLLLFYTLLNGYLLNLMGGYQANTWLVLAGVLLELLLTLFAARALISVPVDPLELAGFIFVVAGVWVYFVSASLPTLLPPTPSVDAVRHYTQALFSYPKGTLVSWYPAGGAFVAAMFSHWLGAAPLRVLHPLASSFIALSAGAVYGITCGLLPPRPLSKLAALLAPAFLFFPWSYFAGVIDGEQYFYAQVFAQFFVIAALWYISSYAALPHWIFLVLLGAALLGTVAAYPYLVALPVALFAIILFARLVRGHILAPQNRLPLLTLVVFAILLILTALALERGGILEIKTLQIANEGSVGEGGVTSPSLAALGGPFFLLLAFAGILPAWRAGARGRTILAFLAAWFLQLGALLVVQPFLSVSGYRVDKTFYVLIFPLAILAALLPAWAITHWGERLHISRRGTAVAFAVALLLLSTGIVILQPPRVFSVFTESELETALWAKDHLDTYQVQALDTEMAHAYWLVIGLWGEKVPNEWYQWIPAGPKLGPATFDEWLHDPAWSPWLYVSDVTRLRAPLPEVVYQNGNSAILFKTVAPTAPPAPTRLSPWEFFETLRLLGYDLPRTTLAPGETLSLTTYTESLYPPSVTVDWRVELTDPAGKVVSKASSAPFGDKYPLQRWSPGQYAREDWSLPLDRGLAPGVYNLGLGLFRRSNGESVDAVPLSSEWELRAWRVAPLARIKIPPAPPSSAELSAATPLQAQVGSAFTLLGYTASSDRTARTVRVALYWKCATVTSTDYTIFVHLLDVAGSVVAQKDAQPFDGVFPTSAWDAGQVLKTEYDLVLPPDAAAPAAIELGMYEQAGLVRVSIGTADHITLNLNW